MTFGICLGQKYLCFGMGSFSEVIQRTVELKLWLKGNQSMI